MRNLTYWGKRLTVALSAVFLLAACSAQQDRYPKKREEGLELIVLHVNDTHSYMAGMDNHGNAAFSEEGSHGGFGRIAMAISNAKKENDNVLALDAGDQFQGTLYYSVNKWPMLAEIDRYMPYDAMTLGNHEFDEGCLELSRFVEQSPFPVLAANLAPHKGCPLLKSKISPYTIREIRGKKVGIIGLSNNKAALSSACKETGFKDTLEVLQDTLADLENQGVQHIILLTHLGLPVDQELARSVEGVDVIVGGHTHSYLGTDSEEGPYPVVEMSPAGHPVLVVTAKRATQYLGELKVSFDNAGIPVSWSGALRELLPEDATSPAISALVRKYTATLEDYRNTIVGYQNIGMADGIDACRKVECLGGMVTTDAMLEHGRKYGAHIALCNGGAIRAGFPKGNITRGDLLTMHPFGNMMVIRECSGAQILEALEHGVSGEKGTGSRLLQVAGLRYVVDAGRPVGERIVKAEIIDTHGNISAIDPQSHYGVILPDYLARGGDNYGMLKDTMALPSPDPIDVDLLERYIRRHTPLPVPSSGRIIRLDQPHSSIQKTFLRVVDSVH